MTNTELQKKIARLEAELAEVKEMAEVMKKRADGGVFKPEDGQEYWSISGSGKAYESRWNDRQFDKNRYAIGNCFPTLQSVLDTVRVLKLIQKARESQGGFVPDWDDEGQDKFSLSLDGMGIRTSTYISLNVAPILGYWGNRSACEQFIIANHDELIWFFTEYRR